MTIGCDDEIQIVRAQWSRPDRREAFRKYTDSRIAAYRTFSKSGLDAARAKYARSIALQQEMWTDAVAASRDVPSVTVVVLPALNATFDIAATRLAATQMHPPASSTSCSR